MATMRDAAGTVEEGLQHIRERISSKEEELKQDAVKAREKVEAAWEDATGLVKKHPAKTVAIALVVGAAFGILWDIVRRRD